MTIRHLLSMLVSSMLITSAAHAACDFKKLVFKNGKDQANLAPIDDQMNFGLEGPDVAWIEVKGKKQCSISGGNYVGIYYSKDQNLLLLEEGSGSCGDHRLMNPLTCQQVGEAARYCGSARLEGGKLINDPPCESFSEDGKVKSCSAGKVFQISPKTCVLTLDRKASQKLTKEKVGIDLPGDKAYRVRNAGSRSAKIEVGKE